MQSNNLTSLFQSTQPKRAATIKSAPCTLSIKISIHAAQEGCDCNHHCRYRRRHISIHAAQEGCDGLMLTRLNMPYIISIHAAQEGCDANTDNTTCSKIISIHAAQEGCDVVLYLKSCFDRMNFNPRSPRGLRQNSYVKSEE